MKRYFNNILSNYGTVLVLIILCLGIALASDDFLTGTNLSNVGRQVTMIAIVAAGMTVVLLTGGIDLSVGSIAGLVGVVTAILLTSGIPVGLSIVLGLLLGAIVGLINGLIITRLNIPFFIVTLAMMTIVRGVGFLLTKGLPVANFPQSFQAIGKGYVGPISVSVLIVAVVYIIFHIMLNYTRMGRYIYAIGGNEEAVRLSGINVKFYTTIVYVICGLTAAMSGIILASRLNSGQPTAGSGYELDAIAAVVIGGTKLSGGEGKIYQTLVGALIMGVLSNGLNLLNVSSYWQFILKGLIILIAVFISAQSNTESAKS
ncbi:MAG: ribose ABC transporter permease [Desulfosporosinus sp. BICA1-9]|nr:MAG: ribose ABC transporter permease [Desulfosporosinus sp. BICA1-9]